ncbi:hypothetical protein B9Z55_019782 [Caenorhabditis nigoni]|uniref:Uncharacterized protein n=1 Tax=Caenorhabditis nigoni TaxID=1611254 RepID=A0A2G5TJU4_9PELO|nr:hypothetical protein B9Z55_019782 [Caenorhabditis nigoni]
MIPVLQLLIFALFLSGSMAKTCQKDKDCITTFELVEKTCSLSTSRYESVNSNNSKKYNNIFEHIEFENFETPQCYVSSKDVNGKSKSGTLYITCYCIKKYFSGCLNTETIAESIYQWRRDPTSKVDDQIKDSEYLDKVDCILKGFENNQIAAPSEFGARDLRIFVFFLDRRPKEFSWVINCNDLSIERFPTSSSQRILIQRLPKNTRLAIDVECPIPDKLDIKMYCTEDYCYHDSIDKDNNILIPMRTYNLFYKSVGNDKYVQNRCLNRSPHKFEFHNPRLKLADHLSYGNWTNMETPTLRQVGGTRQKLKANQNDDLPTSNNHIFSWFFMALYLIPFLFTCFFSICSCKHEIRNEIGVTTNPTLKDIEQTLLMEMRKNEESNVSLKKASKPKSEIIDAAVTTTSQMGNITDLASEGPTGPQGGSIKSVKKDSTALKSVEDPKESTGDAAI